MPLSTQELRSFDGRCREVTVSGPLTLFRLCGRTAAGAANNPYGRFWFNANFFWRMVDVLSDRASDVAELNHYLRYLLREYTAVCHDWNTFASIYELRVPPGRNVVAVVGRVAPQPFDSRPGGALPHELLVGGEFQYVLDVDGQGLRPFVSGPRPLLVFRGHA